MPSAQFVTATRTGHLLRAGKDGGKPDFFGASPADAKFVSTSVVLDDEGDEAKVTGNLTLNGVTKPVTLEVDFHGAGTNPFNKKATIGFEAEGKIRTMPVAERKERRDELYGYAIDIAKGLGDARGAQLLQMLPQTNLYATG